MEWITRTLPAQAPSVREARHMIRDALVAAHAAHLIEGAQVAISELVTNAVVHAGTDTEVRVYATPRGVRAEVTDGSTHAPVSRTWSSTAGTGRGIHLVEGNVDRWDYRLHPHGKTVWFEIGDLSELDISDESGDKPVRRRGDPIGAPVEVILLSVPLLMHWAWQEHAASLLRELMLFALEDDPTVLERHAKASDALSLLAEQLPTPELPEDPAELMANAVEPAVSVGRLSLTVPTGSVAHFEVLNGLLARAIFHARAGDLLGPPTQPEMSELRTWLCEQVSRQASGEAAPRPWTPHTDTRTPLADGAELAKSFEDLANSEEAILATDVNSIIVAVTPPVLRFLGYQHASELLGRRVIAVVPQRFHQAHIAGTTLHVTNGRSTLLDRDVTVPVVCADGSERPVTLTVSPTPTGQGRRAFVARFHLDDVDPRRS